MGWTPDELSAAKRKTRLTVTVFLILLVVFNVLDVEGKYIYFFSIGIVQCAISLALAQILKKGGSCNEVKT